LDFNTVVNRYGTGCIKFDSAAARGKPSDVLPLWVADMDFPAPKPVLDALHERVAHGIFGYSEPCDEYFAALKSWFASRLGYEFKKSWVVLAPGVVYAIGMAIQAFTSAGDAVLIQEPVYYPFRSMVVNNNRKLVVNQLEIINSKYQINFTDFENQIKDNNVKMFVLCSPHNPVGRVWSADELRQMAEICNRYNVLIVSDEIHCDFIFPGHKHMVLAALMPQMQDKIITLTAPSKTFNIAGLQVSNVFISDKNLRKTFQKEIWNSGYSQLNSLGLVACQAAYQHGAEWLESLNAYLWENMMFIDKTLRQKLPKVHLVTPEATYLAWLDFRSLGLTDDDLDKKITEEAKLWLSRGDTFGMGGEGFVRINVGCPRATLETCMDRLIKINYEE